MQKCTGTMYVRVSKRECMHVVCVCVRVSVCVSLTAKTTWCDCS